LQTKRWQRRPGLTKVLHKEVAPFNVRALYVSLGAFNTNMGNAAGIQKAPLDPEYKGSDAEKILQFITGGGFVGDGDPAKAVRAIYEVAAAEGIGAGREEETNLPLGRDLAASVKDMMGQWAHTMEVFGDVCNNVYVEK
jgi:NAD(P)-dependent dehydrogenase (short-subunit alcohol dehydrogenase family)